LLDNGDRHAAHRVVVTVATAGPATAVVRVADDGPGIPAADRDRVFDRFVRLEASRTRHSGETTGTGLGLSIARDIATAHGGSITLTETAADHDGEGHGATFTVRLPLDGPPTEAA
jgi:signal transduction histidine kinase